MTASPPSSPQQPSSHEEQLGQRLRAAREYLGLSQEFVSAQLEIPRASISAIECGKRKVTSREISAFSRLYKRPVTELLAEEPVSLADETTVQALFRTTKELTDDDKEQLLKFAQFLKSAGRPPAPGGDR